jgi:hypothetical protein
MIIDFDDYQDNNTGSEFLYKLKAINPKFKCSVFAVPDNCSEEMLDSVPSWIELCVHGWNHHSVYECANWLKEDIDAVFNDEKVKKYFKRVFKAPGWQISDACYHYCKENGIIVADQLNNAHRWPDGLMVYLYEGYEDRWHGHIQNVCGNGLEETFETLAEIVKNTNNFKFVSEIVTL